MPLGRLKVVVGLGLTAILVFVGVHMAPRPEFSGRTLPDGFSDREYWSLISEFSEPGGFFRSDNFVSNETTFQWVVPDLQRKTQPGGVYLGVGPDQNFTYIAALQPRLAFIVDIRRQNMMTHLMYKALFELSENRAQFLSRLFSRPSPGDLPADVGAEKLFAVFHARGSDPELATDNLQEILRHLRGRHGFPLSTDDADTIAYVYTAFVMAGPDIRYSFPSQYGWRRFPSYSELMLQTDEEGENHSYMASEQHFQAVRRLQLENRIVPVVGDFAGEKALAGVGRYLKERAATVTAFYTSNVEFYLFQTEDWKRFLGNVAELPLDDDSLFIRAYFNNYGLRFPTQSSGARSVTLLDSIPGLLDAFDHGRIHSYFDVIKRSSR